jgi:hypothetical protein
VTLKRTRIFSRIWSVENKSDRFMLVYAQYTRDHGYVAENYEAADLDKILRMYNTVRQVARHSVNLQLEMK